MQAISNCNPCNDPTERELFSPSKRPHLPKSRHSHTDGISAISQSGAACAPCILMMAV